MAKPTKMSMADRVKQKAKEAEFQGGSDTLKLKDGIGFYKLKKGKNEIMVVPFEITNPKNVEGLKPGEMWFRLQILKHFRIGAEDKAVICPRTVGKKCPICEHRANLLNQGRGTDDVEVRELGAKKRELYYVIDLADDDKLKALEVSYHNFGKKLEEEIREADDDSLAASFADPDEGAIMTVRMADAKMGKTTFLEASRIDFQERDKNDVELVAAAMEEVVPFDEILVIHSYEELHNLFYDIDPDEAADTAPARRSSRHSDEDDDPAPSRRRAAKDEDDDPAPARRGRAASKDEDEPDDTPPARRGRASTPKDDDEAPATRRRRAVADNDDHDADAETDAPPAKRGGRVAKPKDEDDEATPPRRGRASKPKDEDDDPAPTTRGRRASKPKDEDEPEDTPPAKRKTSTPVCPDSDGTYGEDCDTLDACEDCEFWADCRDLCDEKNAKKKK